MTKKTTPVNLFLGLRLGVKRTWDSRWHANTGEYGKLLHEDIKIRNYLMKELKQAAVSKVVIERPPKKCRVTIHAARPGLIIGKEGTNIEKLRKKLTEMTKSDTHLNIVEVSKPETDAMLIAQSIAQQLERRVAFRRAMKRAVQSAIRLGIEGIRINCGRLGGAEIARMEWYREGRVPLHTLRADIDYGTAEAQTAYGICGVKVWVFKGDIVEEGSNVPELSPVRANADVSPADSEAAQRQVIPAIQALRYKLEERFPGVQSARVSREAIEAVQENIVATLVGLRKQLSLSQTEVARTMGTTQSAISKIEAGGTDIALSTLLRYGQAVGVEPAKFLNVIAALSSDEVDVQYDVTVFEG